MVAENEWTTLFQSESDECGICGEQHVFEKCPLVENIKETVKDTPAPSYAQLTVPGGLETQQLSDGAKTIKAAKPFAKGVQFGPFIAKTSAIIDVRIDFPIKVFLNGDDGVYLETYDELFCNWLCFVRPATNYTEQNLFCYQIKSSIYFCTTRDIDEGEELRVWYAPYYGEKMGVQMFTKPIDLVHSSDEEFQEIYTMLTNGAAVQVDHTYLAKVKRKRKPSKKTIFGENYYRAIPSNDILPGELLGAKERCKEWHCQKCGQVETSVAAYARHLMDHYQIKNSRLLCPYCPKYFRKDGFHRKLHIDTCKEIHNNKVINKFVTIDERSISHTESVVNEERISNEPGIDSGEKLIARIEKEYDKPFLSDKNDDILDSETDSLMSKTQLTTPILDLSDDIDFNLTKSLVEMINDDCNPDKSSRSLNVFDSITGSSLLTGDIPISSNIGAPTFYTTEKSGYQQTSFASCDDVTDEDRNRIVENLLSETDDRYLTSDYEMTDLECTNENKTGNENAVKKKSAPKTGGEFKCEICKKFFSKQFYLYRHLRKHTGEFRCNQCYSTFGRKQSLLAHRMTCVMEAAMQDKVVRTRMPCSICKMQFSSLSVLKVHIETHYCKGNTWKCGCLKVSEDTSKIENHSCPLGDVSVMCTGCNKVFHSTEEFIDHRKKIAFRKSKVPSLDSSKLCEYCGLTFTSKSGIRYHRYTHKNKKYKCPICKKQFSRLHCLVEHRRTHDLPTLECPICHKKYCTKQKYNDHQRRVHSEKSYPCQKCHKMFQLRCSLAKHMKSHGVGQNYKCEKCNKVFVTKQKYEVHLNSHKDDTHRCHTCDKTFATKFDLQRHIRLRHVDMYTCSYCQADIRYRHSLKKHLMAKHKDKIEEWDSREALTAMLVVKPADEPSGEREKGEVVRNSSPLKDILETAANVLLEDSIPSEHGEPSAVREEEVLNIPVTVIGDLPLVPQVHCEPSLAIDSTKDMISIVDTQPDTNVAGAMELLGGLESVIMNFPITLPVGFQLALDNNQPLKQLSDNNATVVDVGNLQSTNGTSTYFMSDGIIGEPTLPLENNVLYYVIDTSVTDGLAVDPYTDEQSLVDN